MAYPLVGADRFAELLALVGVHDHGVDERTSAAEETRADHETLERESPVEDVPALPDLAENGIVGDIDVLQEDLVDATDVAPEARHAVHVHPRVIRVHEESRDVVTTTAGAGAGVNLNDGPVNPGALAVHLLPAQHPATVDARRSSAQRSHVGPDVGLAHGDREPPGARHHLRDDPLLERLAAVALDRQRPAGVQVVQRDQVRAGPAKLLAERHEQLGPVGLRKRQLVPAELGDLVEQLPGIRALLVPLLHFLLGRLLEHEVPYGLAQELLLFAHECGYGIRH